MNRENLFELLSLGIRIALRLVEVKTGKPAENLTDSEMALALNDIDITPTDEIIDGIVNKNLLD